MRFLLIFALAAPTFAADYKLKATPSTVAWGYYWSQAKPVLRIKSGDTVEIQTMLTNSPERLTAAGVAQDQIESELLGPERASRLRHTILAAMTAEPKYWKRYYGSSGLQLAIDSQYSLSDRIRYYWPQPAVVAALDRLLANLDANPLPLALLSQYLPEEYRAVREGRLSPNARGLAMHHVERVLRQYASACGQTNGTSDDLSAA